MLWSPFCTAGFSLEAACYAKYSLPFLSCLKLFFQMKVSCDKFSTISLVLIQACSFFVKGLEVEGELPEKVSCYQGVFYNYFSIGIYFRKCFRKTRILV